jgi:hypothetical protein
LVAVLVQAQEPALVQAQAQEPALVRAVLLLVVLRRLGWSGALHSR